MYSVSSMKSDRKPPLARSPMRLRPRRVLRPSNSFSLQTPPSPPPGSLTESKRPMEEAELRPEYRTISCELRALTSMVREELGKKRDAENIAFGNSLGVDSGMLFERGRFYDAYSAKRDERLKRKKTGGDYVKAPAAYNLGVAVASAKKSSSKKLESLRKSVSAMEGSRYMLRSRTKGDKKKLPPLPSTFERSSATAAGLDKKIGGSRLRRI